MRIWSAALYIAILVTLASHGGCAASEGDNTATLTASFNFHPASPIIGQAVQFTDTSTGSPTSWQWDFGDGAISSAQNPSHSYAAIGFHSATLTVTNASGSASVSRVLTVITPIPDSFSFSPVQPNIGQVVQFTDTSTGNPTSWLWDFGDGTTSTAHNPSHGYAVAGCYTVTLTASENSGSRTAMLPINVMSASAIMIDHHNTKLANIPAEWITAAKRNLHIAYGMTSRGGQLTYGMTGLVSWKGSQYSWNPGGTDGALDLRNFISHSDAALGFGYPDVQTIAYDLGNPDRTAWEAATREYLALHPEVNVVIWSWCSQMTDPDLLTIQLYYLDPMARLEVDFPRVRFVYMTGHTNGGWWGEEAGWRYANYMRCKQIREHCIKNNRVIYDFNDIESWDPDGNWYGDKLITDSCDYDSDGDGVQDRNWAIDWQSAHPGEWFTCLSPHTQPLSANLKAYAAWWLWARLAGWDGR